MTAVAILIFVLAEIGAYPFPGLLKTLYLGLSYLREKVCEKDGLYCGPSGCWN